MSRGPYPLVLMLAMSMPSATRALGLGEIRVSSALNEPLSAQIDIVGATADQLAELTATVANREAFLRYGAERPAFLSSAIFKVGKDAQGRPLLIIRSGESFTDPLVSLLVDLRWPNGELIRDYSLLLDPAGFTAPAAATAPSLAATARTFAAPAAAVTAGSVATAPRKSKVAAGPPGQHRVAAKDTLRGIARRAGARSESHIQRMMIAIFRTNPQAFEGNINRLHRNVMIALPTAAAVAGISSVDARQEVRAQMTAWRLEGRPGVSHAPVADLASADPAPAANQAPPTAAIERPASDALRPGFATQQPGIDASAADGLKARVLSLEQSLDDLKRQLTSESAKMLGIQQQVARDAVERDAAELAAAAAGPSAPAPMTAARVAAPPKNAQGFIALIGAGFAVLVAGLGFFRWRWRRVLARPPLQEPELQQPALQAPGERAAGNQTNAATVMPKPVPAERSEPVVANVPAVNGSAGSDETTASLAIDIDIEALENSYLDTMLDTAALDAAALRTMGSNAVAITPANLISSTIDPTELDYNLMDLDTTAQHVQMPSVLHEHVVVAERRTNIVDVLRKAIDRDPNRRDLRMKLLEVYYGAAASNRQAFLEVAGKLARERQYLTEGDWQKISMMGRQIASDHALFADLLQAGEDLADCA
jgi:pilus assembly protein FimV